MGSISPPLSAPSLSAANDQTGIPAPVAEKDFSQIESPHAHDVLCGRGGGTNNHIGNNHWRNLVAKNKRLYIQLPKRQKMLVAQSIVRAVRSQDPPGRFLQKDAESGTWYDVGDSKAQDKTSQALREGAPELRIDMEEERKQAQSLAANMANVQNVGSLQSQGVDIPSPFAAPSGRGIMQGPNNPIPLNPQSNYPTSGPQFGEMGKIPIRLPSSSLPQSVLSSQPTPGAVEPNQGNFRIPMGMPTPQEYQQMMFAQQQQQQRMFAQQNQMQMEGRGPVPLMYPHGQVVVGNPNRNPSMNLPFPPQRVPSVQPMGFGFERADQRPRKQKKKKDNHSKVKDSKGKIEESQDFDKNRKEENILDQNNPELSLSPTKFPELHTQSRLTTVPQQFPLTFPQQRLQQLGAHQQHILEHQNIQQKSRDQSFISPPRSRQMQQTPMNCESPVRATKEQLRSGDFPVSQNDESSFSPNPIRSFSPAPGQVFGGSHLTSVFDARNSESLIDDDSLGDDEIQKHPDLHTCDPLRESKWEEVKALIESQSDSNASSNISSPAPGVVKSDMLKKHQNSSSQAPLPPATDETLSPGVDSVVAATKLHFNQSQGMMSIMSNMSDLISVDDLSVGLQEGLSFSRNVSRTLPPGLSRGNSQSNAGMQLDPTILSRGISEMSMGGLSRGFSQDFSGFVNGRDWNRGTGFPGAETDATQMQIQQLQVQLNHHPQMKMRQEQQEQEEVHKENKNTD